MKNTEVDLEITIDKVEKMRNEGASQNEIAEHFGMDVKTFRRIYAAMVTTRGATQVEIARRLLERGMTREETAKCIGLSESTIRSYSNTK